MDSEPISSSAICCVNSHSGIFFGAVLFRFWLKSLKYGESIGATPRGPREWGQVLKCAGGGPQEAALLLLITKG